jgi:AAHS family 4-hydroxybenzoate transporter-like MFS transporter
MGTASVTSMPVTPVPAEPNRAADSQFELGGVIEHQVFGPFALMLLLLTSLTMFLEGFEMQLVGYTAPVMIKALHVDKAAFSSIFAAGNFGYMVGALLLGNLGDRFGQRWLIIVGVFLFSLFTLLSAYVALLPQLVALRFIAGIGLGGAVPNAVTLASEYAPRSQRATRIAFLYVMYTLGGATTGLIAAKLLPAFGWPIVFVIGGWSGLAMCLLLCWFLPESVRYLAQRAPDGERLRRIVSRMVPDQVLPAHLRITPGDEPPAQRARVMALFQDGRAPTTLLLWSAYICGITALQFMTSWLPTLITGAGVGLSLAVFIGALFHIGGTFGNVVVGWLTDRRGIAITAIGFLLAVPIVALIGPASTAVPSLMVAVFFAGFFIVGSQNGLNAVPTIIYPTGMRSTGTGWTTGIGRVGSIIGPVLGGILISGKMPISQLFLCVTVPLALTAGAMALASRRTRDNIRGTI